MNRKYLIILFATTALVVGAAALMSLRATSNPSEARDPGNRSVTAMTPTQDSIASARPALLPVSQPSGRTITPTTGTHPPSDRRVIPLSFDEFDQRILLAPKEIITLRINTGISDNGRIKIDAPNGGSINGHKAPAILSASDAERGVQFAVGPSRGLYTLEVSRGRETRIFEFWVDRESPLGQPGPERTFVH
jgi:hypothetical protein